MGQRRVTHGVRQPEGVRGAPERDRDTVVARDGNCWWHPKKSNTKKMTGLTIAANAGDV
jgi:hypothetical protein